MRDLELFWLLHSDDPSAGDGARLAAGLEELAAQTMQVRVPFLGLLPRVLRHADGRVRAAALMVLSGAEGPSAWPALVDALDDGDPDVRVSALAALHASATAQPARWVHALFHRDPEVRQTAIEGGAPARAGAYSFYLLADEASAPAIRARGVEVPPDAIVALLDFAQQGVVTADEARLWLSKMPWAETARWLERSHRRSPSEIDRILSRRGETEPTQPDALDQLFRLFLDDAADEEVRETFFAKLEAALFGAPFPLRRRIVASLLMVFREVRWFLPRAAGVCALFFHPFLTAAWVPRDTRHGALVRVYANGRRVPRANDTEVEALVRSDLVHPKKGRIDLWALGAVLHYCRGNPYSTLWGWLDVDEVIDAFLVGMESAAPFLTLADGSAKGRKWLLNQIVSRAPERRGDVLAFLVVVAKADELDFLDGVEADALLTCFERLVELETRPDVAFARNKLDRVADAMSHALTDDKADLFLRAYLSLPAAEESPVGRAILGAMSRRESAEVWVGRALKLKTPLLKKLLATLPYATTIPWGKELALAHALSDHVSSAISNWAASRLPAPGRPPPAVRSAEALLIPAEVERRIIDAPETDLADVLLPCLSAPHLGLTYALAQRPEPTQAQPAACAALLGSHDDATEIAAQYERYGGDREELADEIADIAVRAWCNSKNLSAIGNAYLYRFEPHTFRLADQLEAHPEGMAAALDSLSRLASRELSTLAFAGAARFASIFRWRDRRRLETLVDDALLDLCVERLDTEAGRYAAQVLVAFHDARLALPELAARRSDVLSSVADFDDETRRILGSWISSRGLPPRARAIRAHRAPTDEEVLAQIAAQNDLDALELHCRSDDPKVVHEATLRLIVMGQEGIGRLSRLLGADELPPQWPAIADSISLWPDDAHSSALVALRALSATDPRAELRFRVALGLLERGEKDQLPHALDAAIEETSETWFGSTDRVRLFAKSDTRVVARHLAASPHPHAYRPSLELILGLELEEDDVVALHVFLEQGTERIGDLRRRAAAQLLARGDHYGYPILISELFRGEEVDERALVAAAPELLVSVASASLFAGHEIADEKRLLPLVDHEATPREVRDELLQLLLTECHSDALRQAIVQRLGRRPSRARKLHAIADTFAWGVRVGRELTGRVFKFHLIGGRGLGYTRLNENRIHISPLPLLRGARHGREIVEALVLHEIGHHIYHRGDEEQKVWKEAQAEGIHGLLNLVADEHLERNLRATDSAYGNRLKRLIAHAFAHSARELPVVRLFEMLQSRAFAVLTKIRLGVARDSASIRIDNGALLNEMERTGLRFAKFVRALRMGLGRRHGDPLVDEALEMFDKSFRKGDMRSLLAISYRLRDMFGAEVNIMECFGGHEALGEDGADRIIHGEGIEDEEVQREVERVLDPRRRGSHVDGKPGGKLILNVNPDERFEPITHVERIPYDAARHREEGLRVARHARHMRRYLHDLGLSLVPRRMRLSGRRFDRSRATAVVTRGDPRMLISRETQVSTDLFLGVIVDCSGSMSGRSMERARAFGVLLADAARGLPGLDVRLFGFTDRTIYDAGDAKRPAVASLEAGGGNNDAAALHYVAQIARGSRRKAKLLVMISDGLPTECSVSALRSLVLRLSRREGMCCAQVAVRPLEEKCFPHYVEVMDDEFHAAVRRFGNIIAGLVKKAMAA